MHDDGSLRVCSVVCCLQVYRTIDHLVFVFVIIVITMVLIVSVVTYLILLVTLLNPKTALWLIRRSF